MSKRKPFRWCGRVAVLQYNPKNTEKYDSFVRIVNAGKGAFGQEWLPVSFERRIRAGDRVHVIIEVEPGTKP